MYWQVFIFSMMMILFLNVVNSRMGSFDDENEKYATQKLYDDKFKDITNKIDMLSTSNDDLHIKFDKNNRRHEEDLMSLKNSLEDIKELLQGGKEYRMPNDIGRTEKEMEELLANNVGEELNKMLKKLLTAQHGDLQDVKDALRNETTELRDQFQKQNRLLKELEDKFRKLDEQLQSDSKDDQNQKIDALGDELNTVINKLVRDHHNDLQDVSKTLSTATASLQEKLQKQNQLLAELQEKFNRIDGQRKDEKVKDNINETVGSAIKTLRTDLEDFRKQLKRDLQEEFGKQSRPLAELQDKLNQMDQQIKTKLEEESYMVKNEIDGEFQKHSRLFGELEEKLTKASQQIQSKLDIESGTLKNVMQEELQKHNRLLEEFEVKLNTTGEEIKIKLDMDAIRAANLTDKFDQMGVELSANMNNIKDSLKDDLQKEFEQNKHLLGELQGKLNEMAQQILQMLGKTTENLIEKVDAMKEDLLTKQSKSLGEIRDALQKELREGLEKQNRLVGELKDKIEQQIQNDLEREHSLIELLSKMKKDILIANQNEVRDLKETVKTEFEKQNQVLVELQATLNKLDQQVVKKDDFTEELSKMKEELLTEQYNNVAELKDLFQEEITAVREELQKQYDILIGLQENYVKLIEDVKNALEVQNGGDVMKELQERVSRIENQLRDFQNTVSTGLQKINATLMRAAEEPQLGSTADTSKLDQIGGDQIVNQHTNDSPSSCAEVLANNNKANGIYKLFLAHRDMESFDVYCQRDENNDGGAWTLIQRRLDGSVDFFRNWKDYKDGFGNINGEFFIGLDKLHALTSLEAQELYIYLENIAGEVRYVKYSAFGISNDRLQYMLSTLGTYSGNAGDALGASRGQRFTTKDQDNDQNNSANCAKQTLGAWWHRKCCTSNLNGQYIGDFKPKETGIIWDTWYLYSWKYVYMAIRPINKSRTKA